MKQDKQRLREKYEKEVVERLMQDFGLKNRLSVPKITKIVVNMGVGSLAKDKALLEQAISDLADITGQKPSIRLARISVASFGVRRGMPVGLKVTLRRDRMYAFLEKLISVVFPRFRDFKGLSLSSFDSRGNYTLGIQEHTVFPEIDAAKSTPKGLEITIVTNANSKEKAVRLLKYLGVPFEK